LVILAIENIMERDLDIVDQETGGSARY